MTQVLRVNASMRREGSRSRAMADHLVERWMREAGKLTIAERDLADGVPYVDAAWIGANFTDPDARSTEQRAALSHSDALLAELRAADLLLLASPIYNFSVPAALKAWIDMVARVGVSFRYTASGPEGLLTGKRAIVLLASGGTEAESALDFASPYLRHILGFVGIDDVTIIGSAQRGQDPAVADAPALQAIDGLTLAG